MNKVDELPITKEINIDKNHIDNFKLETETGTKRVKEKFHKEAVNNRNNYVNKQLNIFSNYKVQLENEMVKRVKDLIPKDKSSEYEEYKKRVNSLLELVKLNCNITDKIKVFIQNYIETVSIEHEKYKTNITDKMVEYFYDDENKEKADMPEFLAMGGFRNNIIIVKNFEIQKIKKLPYKDIDGYSVNVQFIIYDKSKENEEYVKKIDYWIVSHNNNFYIYGDNFLKDIFILEKDMN